MYVFGGEQLARRLQNNSKLYQLTISDKLDTEGTLGMIPTSIEIEETDIDAPSNA